VAAPTIVAPAVLNRADLTKRLVAKLVRDEAVVAGIGNTNFDLYAAGHRSQNFYMLGSMGLACPIALGVALAQPERGVIALEGDGSILMALGCLATIGMVKPRNLTIVIMDNGIYQITGRQKAATASSADIVAIARGAGIANSHWVRDQAHFRGTGDAALRRGRPGPAGGEDRRCARHRADRARPAAHPPSLHARARHRSGQRARRLEIALGMRARPRSCR
jgi:thiamine pyrophosphate-dependent acetolactate synthase large subunit-like protein